MDEPPKPPALRLVASTDSPSRRPFDWMSGIFARAIMEARSVTGGKADFRAVERD